MKRNPVSISHTVWYANDIRRGEREAADALGLIPHELTLCADETAFQVCRSAHPDTRHWSVLCDRGNNGDDGYVVVRLVETIGINVTLLAQESDKPLPEEATLAREAWLNTGGEIHASNIVWPESVDLTVDALLGIGLQQAPRESIDQLTDYANTHPVPIMAVDIPSGLLAGTGVMPGVVISTDHTVTSIALKPSLLIERARDVIRQLHSDSLGLDS